ncbi:MAG: shikimate dehydrogenase [Clostridia bacterium]|nr:shikimate dehydrogenase [Clostridia bacterium]
MIGVDTKLVALLGKPLAQSFSPRMQNETYEALGLDYYYFPAESTEEDLETIVKAVRVMNFAGLGVTKPYKLAVMQYLDALDVSAEKMGAVNTVVKTEEGKLIGYNTDGYGFVESMKMQGVGDVSGDAFLCLGAGGAGRAVAIALAMHGVRKIYVTDLFPQSAKCLVEDINTKVAPVAEFIEFDPEAIKAASLDCRFMLNNTGVGMKGHEGESPVDPELFRPDMYAFDATYNPARTQFLLDAEAKGAKVWNGLGMLVYQGAKQVELWSGKANAAEHMMRVTEQIVREMAD